MVATLFLSPLSLHSSSLRPHHCSSSETHLCNSLLWQKSSSIRLKPSNFRNISAVIVTGSSNSHDPKDLKSFLDENGAVDDMEDYLNTLSLEYDSVWDTKPSWCQPWTITLTGGVVIACSWLILHSLVVTGVASSLIFAWWYIFLYSYPKVYSDMIAERRKKVTNGVEDTFGLEKSQ